MAIHDIGTNKDRSNTAPNTSDVVANRMAHQTASTQYNPVGEQSSSRIYQVGKSIISNDGSNNNCLFGYNPALDKWGMFSTKSGVDVLTNTDLNEFTFNSSQNVFKINEVINATLTAKNLPVNATGYTAGIGLALQITHGLSYTPQVTGYIDLGGGGSYIPLPAIQYGVVPSGPLAGSPYWIQTYIGTTPTYINILANIMVLNVTGATGQSVGTSADNVKLYIVQETAN